MQVQRVQFNNPHTSTLGVNINSRTREKEVAFKSNNKIKNLQIENKNPLITDETREVVNELHKLFKSVEGKTLTIEGLSVGTPVETYLNLTLNFLILWKFNYLT